MQRNFNPAQLNELSKALFEVPAAAALNVLPELIAKRQQQQTELNNSERAATKARLDQIAELDAARNNLITAFWELDAKAGNAMRQTRIDFAEWLTSILRGKADFQEDFKQGLAQWRFHAGDFDNWMKDTRAAFANFWPQLQTDFAASVATWEKALPDFSGWMERTKAAFTGWWSQLWKDLKAGLPGLPTGGGGSGGGPAPESPLIPETVNVFSLTSDGGGGAAGPLVFKGPGTGPTGGYGPASFNQSTGYGPGSRATQSILPGVSDYQAPPPKRIDFHFATGGMVRGPGTATSDSIIARLSAGEFVMRAAAVSRLGAGFLSRLNGFADGGMAMPSRGIPRFAGGGMASATTSDGTPVNLIFPGGTFALRADNETVGALTREARRAGMLSGGRRAGLLQ